MPLKRFATGSKFFRTGVWIAVFAAAVFCCPVMAAEEEAPPLEWQPSKMLGYDGNGDGLWDDVEKYSVWRAQESPTLRDRILDMARTYQNALLAKTPEEAYAAWAETERARNCLQDHFGKYKRQADAIESELDLLLFGKTELRNKAFLEFSDLLEGQTLLEQPCVAE